MVWMLNDEAKNWFFFSPGQRSFSWSDVFFPPLFLSDVCSSSRGTDGLVLWVVIYKAAGVKRAGFWADIDGHALELGHLRDGHGVGGSQRVGVHLFDDCWRDRTRPQVRRDRHAACRLIGVEVVSRARFPFFFVCVFLLCKHAILVVWTGNVCILLSCAINRSFNLSVLPKEKYCNLMSKAKS